MSPAHPNPSFDMAVLLDSQRSAFLKEGPPGLAERKARLKRLRAAVLARWGEVGEAIGADFWHRSRTRPISWRSSASSRGSTI